MDEKIDREQIKDPREVSGWGRIGEGPDRQDYSDIARKTDVKPEFEPGVGETVLQGRCDGSGSSR